MPSNIDSANGPTSKDATNDAPAISASAPRTAFEREDSALRSKGNRRTGEKNANDKANARNATSPCQTNAIGRAPSPAFAIIAGTVARISAAGAAQDPQTQAVTLWCIIEIGL